MLKKRLQSIQCSELIPLINEVIDHGSKEDIELLKKTTMSITLVANNSGYKLGEATFLHYVAAMDDAKTLEKMIDHGFDYNAHLTEWNGAEVRVSALMLACFFNSADIVPILLSKNANFSGYTQNKENLIEIAAVNSNREIIDLLLNHAKNNERVKELLSRTVLNGSELGTTFDPESVMTNLIQIILIPQLNSNLILKDLRFFSDLINSYYQATYKVVPIKTDKPIYNKISALSFFHSTAVDDQITKEMAITNALASYKKILADPLTCFTLLKKLENAITLNVEAKFHISNLTEIGSSEYTLESHLAMKWPIPQSSYQPLKLDSLLSISIIGELQKFGFGQSSYKWYGFVNDKIASSHIIDGAHTTEDTLDISALLHGKYSHSIQLLLLMYAIEDNLIDIFYGADQQLEILDLLRGLVTPATDGKKLWTATNDRIYFDHPSFSGPHFLHSILMRDGHKYDLPNIEQALKNSFCKALLRSMKFYNQNHDGEFLSPKHLWDNFISLHNPRIFFRCREKKLLF